MKTQKTATAGVLGVSARKGTYAGQADVERRRYKEKSNRQAIIKGGETTPEVKAGSAGKAAGETPATQVIQLLLGGAHASQPG